MQYDHAEGVSKNERDAVQKKGLRGCMRIGALCRRKCAESEEQRRRSSILATVALARATEKKRTLETRSSLIASNQRIACMSLRRGRDEQISVATAWQMNSGKNTQVGTICFEA